MKTQYWLGSLAALALAALPLLAQAKVGAPAPAFSGTDINGKVHKLSDYKGRIVVLEAFNPDCPFSANHYKTGAMPALQQALASKGVVWLVVNSTAASHASYRKPEAARREWQTLGMKATAWIDDHQGNIGRLYGMKTTPHLFVIDAQGTLVYAGSVDDLPDANADPRTAKNYVRATVEALLAGRPVPVAETKPYGCSVKYAE
ncbi:MAG: redoxin domain-containing protein [Verrucomicrobia bacterium]|nr:redoxin domain-containing protein [Verrucomicrobiota bacterium]